MEKLKHVGMGYFRPMIAVSMIPRMGFTKEERLSLYKAIDIVGEYVNTETKVECHCRICGKIWYSTPHTLKSGHGCPGCARNGSRMTKGHENTTELMKIAVKEYA